MKVLNQTELKSIEQFFKLAESQLHKAMRHYLETKYEKVLVSKDYVIAVGNIPIALIAHLDTVFKLGPKDIYYDRYKNVMWSPDGLGADDRAGVYSIIQILKAGLRPTVILTCGEEIGGVGATALIKDYPQPFTEIKYLIELDRRGVNDCVFYDCANPDFNEYIESFGFITNFGTFTDINIICPKWGVAGVNLSIGYYNEHSTSEILHIGQMYSTITKVKKMLEDAANAPEYYYIPAKNNFTSAFCYDPLIDWDPSYGISKADWARFMEPQSKCRKCSQWDFDYNLFPTKGENGETIFFCADCLLQIKDLHWCPTCGEPFIDKSLSVGEISKCKDCREG